MALNDHPWAPGMDRRIEILLRDGLAEEAVLVFPDCFTRLGGSQYVNSAYLGNYEDYLIAELVPFVDEELRTKGDGFRGLFGKSSGGFAALRLGMRHPELFSALASHSGDVSFDLCYLPDFPKAARGLVQAGGFDAFLEAFESHEKKKGEQIHVLNICAMAAAYSPLEDGSGFELPFEENCLELNEEVWRRWLDFDPLEMLKSQKHREALRKMKLLYLDAGTLDEWNLDFGARRFSKALRLHEIEHVFEGFEDGHMGTSYRYDRSLSILTKALSKP
jgi:pimeloyl-ACP methyl ester carboxylesterase